MTDVTTDKIVGQLRMLLQLTESEIQLATVRQTQARTDAVRKELAENAQNSEVRSRLIAETLRSRGGVPDVVSPAVGRITAVVKSGIEQTQPLHEALLGELALEHQILDRARYLKVLATT
ncbi:MAG: ferritin-like domain-containing protein, partial [Actinomycetota bacterium]|nr:ferritin-like domain-containing protein [Actinomycetota bacterium]